MYIPVRNKKVENILRRLERYPVTKVDPITAQSFSRNKYIRYLSKQDKIFITKGVISIPEYSKVFNKKNKWFFE